MTAPEISVIIPVRDQAAQLADGLRALARSTFRDHEVIVVDDGSRDGLDSVVAEHPSVRCVRVPKPRGASFCRNLGAEHARGRVLFFTDADVSIHVDALAAAVRRLEGRERAAVIGTYLLEHPHPELASRYKNAWIRHTYLRRAGRIDWFFTALGALPRSLFRDCGGFDVDLSVKTGGGDVELGARLRGRGIEIDLDERVTGVHRKRHTLRSLLLNDLRRAYGWTRVALRTRGRTRLLGTGIANASRPFVAGVTLSWALAASLILAPFLPWPLGPATSGGLLALYLSASAGFLRFLGRSFSPGFVLACLPIHWLDHLACGVGVLGALLHAPFDRTTSESQACGRPR
jgi:glycosyltransferase involved in cell wall biosynthesis